MTVRRTDQEGPAPGGEPERPGRAGMTVRRTDQEGDVIIPLPLFSPPN